MRGKHREEMERKGTERKGKRKIQEERQGDNEVD